MSDRLDAAEQDPRLRRALLGLNAAGILGGVLLRLLDARIHPFTPDQGFTLDLARGTWADLVARTAADTHPPLYYAVVKLWYELFPPTLHSAQVLSVIFAAATMALAAAMAWRRFGPLAAAAATLCWAFSPYLIYWNHSTRNHQMLPLAIMAAIWCGWEWMRGGGRGWLWGVAGGWVLAFQINYMAFPAGAAWGLAILAGEGPWQRKAACLGASIAGPVSTLWWIEVLARHATAGPGRHHFFQETVSPVYLYFHALFGAQVPYQPNKSGPLFWAQMALFAGVCVSAGRRVGRAWDAWVLLALLPTLPIVVAKLWGMTLAERHLAFALPWFLVVWGVGVREVLGKISLREKRGEQKAK